MIKKMIIIFMFAALTGCMPYLTQDFRGYPFNGKEIKVGMSASEVSEIAGQPTKVTLPESLSDITNNTMFANDIVFIYSSRYQSYREYWLYGSLENGDKEEIKITFTNGRVTRIQKCIKK